jgi:hypothetical protein
MMVILAVKLLLILTFLLTMSALNIFFKIEEDCDFNIMIKRIARDFLIILVLFCFISTLVIANVQ